MTRLGSYRYVHFAVVVALLLSMAMPLVTYACDMTGLIETAMTMADLSDHGEESDCPCEGPMQDLCGSSASDCDVVSSCHGDSYDDDACCSSQPKIHDAVASASDKSRHVAAVVLYLLPDHSVHDADRPPVSAPGYQRAPPQGVKAPVHILHSSLLL